MDRMFGRMSNAAPKSRKNKLFAHVGHDCDMPEEPDYVLEHCPGDGFASRVKRYCLRKTIVSEKIVGRLLQSHYAIRQEKIGHIWNHRFIIHPFSEFQINYHIFMLVLDIIQLIMVPLDVAYFGFVNTIPMISSNYWKILRWTFDIICVMDIGLSMSTGYYDIYRKEVILDRSMILSKYFKGLFFFDLLTSMPTHWELLFSSLKQDQSLIYTFQALSLLKILRYANLYNNFKKVCTIKKINYYTREITIIIVSWLLYWHIMACLVTIYKLFGYYIMGKYEQYYHWDSQVEVTRYVVYAISIYVGALVAATSAPGIGVFDNAFSNGCMILLWLMSKLAQILVMARLIEITKAYTAANIQYKKKMEQQIEFMRYKKLPVHTQKRIERYFEYHYRQNFFREDEIFATISGQLKQEVVMHCCRKLVENVEFFQNIPFNLLVRIVACLRAETYMENDLICKAGSRGHSMYFIASGTVALYTPSGKEICHLEDGDHFGEIALIMDKNTRVASVTAIEICVVYRLDRADFNKAIRPYPDLLDHIQKIASQRKEETEFLDEHNRRQTAENAD